MKDTEWIVKRGMFNRAKHKRGRTMTRLAVLMLAALIIAPAHAQNYPSKTVRWIVSLPSGGSTDLISRLLAARMPMRSRGCVPGTGGRPLHRLLCAHDRVGRSSDLTLASHAHLHTCGAYAL